MRMFHYMRQIKGLASLLAFAVVLPARAGRAHVSEQGFVLLLPTDVYISAGATCVALTVLVLTLLPDRAVTGLFRPVATLRWPTWTGARLFTSGLSFAALLMLLWVGLTGPRDPLANPLTLVIWTVWWIGFVTLQGVFGNLWRWVNPWTGPVALTRHVLQLRPALRLPACLGQSVGVATFLGFVAFLLADPAPADPARLAGYAAGYWLFTYVALLVFGPRWAMRGDGISMLMRFYATLGLFGRLRGRLALGLTGWQALHRTPPRAGAAVFMLLMLGCGSFDGLNETFWWLDLIGINPLEFPGRSAVIAQNLAGLLIVNALLVSAYGLAVWMGARLVAADVGPGLAFRLFAPSILPIALGYHIAHYLTSFLVDGQYALAALNDPLARGDDLLGLGTFYVTTGFFNAPDSVRTIWLTQAGAVVAGHVLAVMMAHAIALHRFGDSRKAALSQAPLALFMVFYTLFGLWLLASPRGA